ncbi:MAG: hypothetical protein ACM3UU_10065 [Ignavibacteriales bacterium]
MKKDSKKPRSINNDSQSKTEEIKSLNKKNKAAALGLAVLFATSTILTGCWPFPKTAEEKEKEEEQSYWSSGSSSYHSHYYGGWGNVFGSSNRGGLFGNSYGSTYSGGTVKSFSNSGYSSHRGGSFSG